MFRSLVTCVVAPVAVVLVGSVALLISTISGRSDVLYRAALPTCSFLSWVAGIRLTVRGQERLDPTRNYLFVANHASNVDPPIAFLAIGRHTRIVSKAAVFKLPVFGKVMQRAGFVPVDRGNRRQAVEAVKRGTETLQSGHDLLVFPEGTRSVTGALQPFKRGPFLMAARAQSAIVPMAIRGTANVQPRGSTLVRGAAVDIELLTPIETADLEPPQRAALGELTRAAIEQVLRGNREA